MFHRYFSNPFKKGYGFEEKKIVKMFWKNGEADRIQKWFVLAIPMRTKGLGLIDVLNADRVGAETWEIYYFKHGLAIRNPGSWLPSTN